jgi:hypothetical protein
MTLADDLRRARGEGEGKDPLDFTSELETKGDFDFPALEEVLADVLGVDVAPMVIARAKESVQQNGGDWDAFTNPAAIDSAVNLVMQTVWSVDGEESMRAVHDGIRNFDIDERLEGQTNFDRERSSEDLRSFNPPLNAYEGELQLNSFTDYLNDTFKGDREMSILLGEVWRDIKGNAFQRSAPALRGMVGRELERSFPGGDPRNEVGPGRGVADAAGDRQDSFGDPNMINPDEFVRRVREAIAGNGQWAPRTEEEKANAIILMDALHDEWMTGRAALPFDHPDRDPNGIVKEVEEANDSPRSKDLLSDGRIATREIQYQDITKVLGLDNLTDQARADLERQIKHGSWSFFTPEEQNTKIAEALRTGQKNVIDYIWETSILAYDEFGLDGRSDPNEAINTRISRDEINQLLNLDVNAAAEEIVSGGAPAVAGFFGRMKEKVSTIEQRLAASRATVKEPSVGTGLIAASGALAEGLEFARSGMGYKAPERVTRLELNQLFFDMSDVKFRQLQLGAWQAGLYGDTEIEDVPFGDRSDEVSRGHWNGAIQKSSESARLGIKETFEDILANASESGLEGRRRQVEDFRDTAKSERRIAEAITSAETTGIELSDPLSIAGRADEMAQRLMGRNATPEERRLLVGVVQEGQRQDQTSRARFAAGQRANAQLSTAIELEAQADELERELEAQLSEGEIRSKSSTNRQAREAINSNPGVLDEGAGQQILRRDAAIDDLRPQNDVSGGGAGTRIDTSGNGLQIKEFTEFDGSAFMENWLKQKNPEEVQGLAVRDSFNTFLRAIRSPVRG